MQKQVQAAESAQAEQTATAEKLQAQAAELQQKLEAAEKDAAAARTELDEVSKQVSKPGKAAAAEARWFV